jgi:hypothetical protein
MQSQPEIKREIINELYRAFVLLGAKMDLLGTVGSWKDSLPDQDVLSSLRAWNSSTLEELKQRIEHYGTSCHRPVDSRGEEPQTVPQDQ